MSKISDYVEEVDDIDTSFLINDKLSFDQVERLRDIASSLTPYIQGVGTQDEITNALRLVTSISRLLERAGRAEPRGDPNVDTTACQLCGENFTGTNEEIAAWEPIHIEKVHPEYFRNP